MSRELGGRWAKLADVLERDMERKPRTFRSQVWIDQHSGQFHADSHCATIFPRGFVPYELAGMLSEQGALALGYWRCWRCYPLEMEP